MKIDVALDNNFIPDKYAKFAPDQYRLEDTPVVNFPIKVSDVPTGTESLSVVFIDYDSVPVAGFVWIHWLAANLPVGDIPEDLSTHSMHNIVWTIQHLRKAILVQCHQIKLMTIH